MNKKSFEVLKLLSDSISSYEAVVWLGTPHQKLDGRTPHDMMKRNNTERVRAVLVEYIKESKLKRKKRSSK